MSWKVCGTMSQPMVALMSSYISLTRPVACCSVIRFYSRQRLPPVERDLRPARRCGRNHESLAFAFSKFPYFRTVAYAQRTGCMIQIYPFDEGGIAGHEPALVPPSTLSFRYTSSELASAVRRLSPAPECTWRAACQLTAGVSPSWRLRHSQPAPIHRIPEIGLFAILYYNRCNTAPE